MLATKGIEIMNEVYVIAKAIARPGKAELLEAALKAMLAPTRAESGCKLYELHKAEKSGQFYFYEIWQSHESLERHVETPHFQNLQKQLEGLLEGELEINLMRKIEI
jgi:quinol monooxygenase YgiN